MNSNKRSITSLLPVTLVALPPLLGLGYALSASLGLIDVGSGGPTLQYLREVAASHTTWVAVGWTLWIATASTVLATLAAVILASTFRAESKTDRIGRLVAVLPLPVPHVVAALSSLLILGQSGLLSRFANAAEIFSTPAEMPPMVYDRLGVGLIFALVWKETPFLALIAFTVLKSRGGLLEESARSLGANRLQTFLYATWPVLWRGMLPGVVAVATFVAGSYETAALLAPSRPLALPLLTMERYTNAALELRPEAFVLAGFSLLVSLAAVAVYGAMISRAENFK
ncbi:MAG: ABC transporter permease subunit [Gemmatimonadales bacterium]